jgi:hypothetical protein
MASVTNSPTLIGGAGGNLRVIVGSGPWLYSSNLYVVLTGPTGIYVYQSTDSGASWAELDSGNKPADSGGEVYADMHSSGSVIEIAYRDSAFKARTVQFDLDTSLYTNDMEVPHDGGKYSVVAVRSNGDKFIATGGTGKTQWALYDGTWAEEDNEISQHIDYNPGTETTRPYSAAVDADDTIHLIYGRLTAGGTRTFFHRSISSPANVVSDYTSVGSSTADDANAVGILGGTLIVPTIGFIATLEVPMAFIGAPKSAPLWSTEKPRLPRKPFRSTGLVNNGSFYHFSSHRENLTDVEQIGLRPYDGGWGGELNWYDANINAPNISSPPDPQLIQEISVRAYSNVFHCVATMRETSSTSSAFYMSDSDDYAGGGPGEPPPGPTPPEPPAPPADDEDPDDPLPPGTSPTPPTPAVTVPCYTFQRKHPDETIPLMVDASDWLEDGDAISSATWSADSGITIDGNWHDDAKAVAQISGGTDDTEYIVVAEIATEAGRTELKHIELRVAECS